MEGDMKRLKPEQETAILEWIRANNGRIKKNEISS